MNPSSSAPEDLKKPIPPDSVVKRINELESYRKIYAKRSEEICTQMEAIDHYLRLSPQISGALDTLSEQLFGKVAALLEDKISLAIQEIIEQPIRFKVERGYKANSVALSFSIEKEGLEEDILKGQGGSITNIISVGLRMFALAQLDPKIHRRFLMLDEQDCWLRPELVPRLVKIIHEAGQALGFQVILISHHDVRFFQEYAEKMVQFTPSPEGIQIREIFV